MNYTNKITKNFLYFIRQLQDENPSKGNQTIPTPNNDVQKQQLRDLYIYIYCNINNYNNFNFRWICFISKMCRKKGITRN